ncbi:MAG TPA: putative baseplate assembly protein, partial [Thermoanaerobaculia bacterium]|nr:putative baseplate assembly protein [Thermoanaerobaculia bacterium]
GAITIDGGRPHVFVKASDGNVWVNWWSGSAWNWSNQGTPSKNVEVVGASGITAIDGARPYLFVRGSDGNLWVNWWSGSAWTWTNQGTPADVDIVAGVGAIAVDNKRPYAFVIGSDGNLWVNWWNGSAWTWTNQGTPPNLRLVGEAGAIVVDGGRPYIFFTAGEGDLWVNWWSGSAWGWSDQGVPTFAALIPNTPVAKSGLTLEQLTAAKRSLSDPLVKASFESHAWNASDLRMLAQLQGWPLDDLAETIRRYAAAFAKSSLGFFNFALKAAPFGHNAPHFDVVQDGTTFKQQPSEFNAMTLGAQGHGLPGRVFLDNVYQDLSASSVAVFTRAASPDPRNSTQFQPELRRIHDVTAVRDATRTSLSLNGKVTSIDVAPSNDLADFYVRTTTILAGSKRFDATEAPVKETVEGTHLELDGVFVRLAVGQKIAIAGERADAPGVSVREVRVLTEVLVAGVTTKVTLDSPLVYSYLRSSVTFCANVAASTHGETVDEVLGNGDAGTPYQRFTLRQVPLTYVASESASGVDSTLRITVNDVIWKEVPTLFGHGPRERIYVTHRADNGAVTVQFGDGVTGARLPGGQGNVRARYRKGIGLEGLVGPDKLTLLLSRPLGLKSVTNPIAAADAADPEPRDEARTNAPLTVLTLDRVVSLSDYEDFVRGRAGVAKALATLMTGPEHRGVFVTVAGPNGNAISNTAAIEDALHLFGNRLVPLKVRAYREVFFRLTASVKVAPDHLPDVVQAAIETTLRDTFSFDKRAFGQPVYASEIIALIQDVDGVLSVNLTKLETDFQKVAPLLANVPEGDLHDANLGAELLALDPRPIALVVTQ